MITIAETMGIEAMTYPHPIAPLCQSAGILPSTTYQAFTMRLFDSHCHIDLDDFAHDRDAVLAAARAVGVRDILVPAVQRRTWPQLQQLCAADGHLYPALGLHPVYLERHDTADVDALDGAVCAQRPVAIGEIGLDWQIRALDRGIQQRFLEAQLAVAQAHDLPVVLHVRKAHDAMLNTLRRFDLPGGFCHAFNGSLQQAARYLDLGFRLGFGGMLTFERSSRLRRLAAELPSEALVLETDAPDMTVASHRYERNSPEYLPEVLMALAEVRGETPESLAESTTANARQVLRLPDDDPSAV
jgi:TatD DNase family protein